MHEREHPLHSMSSYLGSFPPRLPRRIIEEWLPRRATVLDPFCGSGTTLVEASISGRRPIGADLNPLAIALSQAKLAHVTVSDLEFRLNDLAHGFRGETEIDEFPELLRPIFHPRTLAQLCYLQRSLVEANPEDIFLRGCILGIMHGKHRKDGSTAYLSVDMPNTFSMSPAYVKRFVEERGLQQPPVDVLGKLRERCRWLLRTGSLRERPDSLVVAADGAQIHKALTRQGISSVGGIITSPPYLGILRYGAFNWIRLWFLGFQQGEVDRHLDGTDSLDVYLSFMATFLDSAAHLLHPGAIAALVIGDVVENGQHLSLGERVWEELRGVAPFELARLEADDYDSTSKTTRVWGQERRGRATPGDRILVLRRRRIAGSARRRSNRPRGAPKALGGELPENRLGSSADC